MQIIARYKFHAVAALALLLTVAVVAAKPPQPPPPPPPPAATYEVQYLWNGNVLAMNDAGDMTGYGIVDGVADGTNYLYLADLDALVDPNWFLSAEDAQRWFIHAIDGGINNVNEFVCWATYLPNDGVLVRNGRYPCRVNRITGTIEPFITSVPPGHPNPWPCRITGLADDGTVGGYFTIGDRQYAFIVSSNNELSYPLGGPLDNPVWDSYVEGMNDSGQVVGRVFPYPYYASGLFSYRYTPDTGEMVILDSKAQAQAINNHGDIAGQHEITVTVTTTKPPRTTTTTSYPTFRYSDDPTAYSDDDANGIKNFGVYYYPQGINDLGDILADGQPTIGGMIYLEQKKLWQDLLAPGVVQGTAQDVATWYQTTNADGTSRVRDDNSLLNNAGTICGTMKMSSNSWRVYVLRRKS